MEPKARNEAGKRLQMKATPTIEDLRDAWRTERRHEAQLSEALVHDIAWRLVQSGHQPTAAAVRKVHGGGSPNLIHPALHSFFAGELQDRWVMPNDPDVPAPLMELWRTCLKAARETAQEATAATREGLSKREKTLEERESNLRPQTDVMESRQRESDKRIHELRGRLAQTLRNERSLRAQRQQLMEALEREREKLKSADNELTQARQRLARQEHKIDALTDGLQKATRAYNDTKEQNQTLTQQATEQAKEIIAHTARAESLAQQLEDLGSRYEELQQEHADATDAARKEQQSITGEINRLGSELSESETQRAAAEKECTQLRSERDSAIQAAADERKQYQGLQAALTALTRELKAQSETRKNGDRQE